MDVYTAVTSSNYSPFNSFTPDDFLEGKQPPACFCGSCGAPIPLGVYEADTECPCCGTEVAQELEH